jgi:ubiquinone/menaquinone biosynthesis C-methylase UbiE
LAWARTPGHDVWFSELNLPAFAELLPPAGSRTLDLGCGEGRIGRWLTERGHRVSGIDTSPTLLAAARRAGGYAELVEGSAADLPWPDGAFDLAIAFMTLQDMPDARTTIAQTGRVLAPGGVLCIAIVHPLNRSAAAMEDYFVDHRSVDVVQRDGLPMHFDKVDRPLEHYTRALSAAGFVIEELREPRPTAEALRRHPRLESAARTPFLLHLRARLDR